MKQIWWVFDDNYVPNRSGGGGWGGEHIVFGVDPVGVTVSCVHNFS